MRVFALLATAWIATGCAPATALRTPEPDGFFAKYYRGKLNSPNALPPCPVAPLGLGPTLPVQMRKLKLRLFLPADYLVGPLHQVIERNTPDARGLRPEGQEWLTGIYLMPVEWYRWSRIQTAPGQSLVDAPASVVQLAQLRDYSSFTAERPWDIRAREECVFQLEGRTARVLRFTLVHPTKHTQWGLTAYWRGRPDDGWISFLGIGPDEASQAEFLAIIRAHRP